MDQVDRRISKEDSNAESRQFLPESLKRGKALSELKWRDSVPQIIASCMAYCVVIQAGANMGYSTVLTGGLQSSNNDNITINDDQASWLASLVTISLPLGSLLSGPLMDHFGRKTVCILTCIPSTLSWLILTFSHSLPPLYTARTIAGISGGLSTASIVYVMEISHPSIRAMLLSLNSVFVSLGILLTCVLAVFLDWRKIAVVFSILNTTFLVLLCIIPESPYWLICFDPITISSSGLTSKRRKTAEKYLRWLNPREVIFEQELGRIIESRPAKVQDTAGSEGMLRIYLESLKSPTVWKPISLLFVILLVQQLSGAYVVIFYAISVFRQIGGTFGGGLNEYGALVLLGIIRFVMSVITSLLSRRIGRRTLCIVSGLGMAFSMFFSAMLIYLTSFCGTNGEGQQKWMLLVIVLFYVCMSSLGFVVIPWSLIGELLPISFRGLGGGVMVSIAYVMMFGVIKSYPFALNAMGAQNVFFAFSAVSLIGTAVIYLFLPETLGKSFKEIEGYFEGARAVESSESEGKRHRRP